MQLVMAAMQLVVVVAPGYSWWWRHRVTSGVTGSSGDTNGSSGDTNGSSGVE